MTSRRPTSAYKAAAALTLTLALATPARAENLLAPSSSPSASTSLSTATAPTLAPRARWAPIAGALTLLLPLIASSVLWSHDDRPDLQHQGVYLATGGFIAAPLVAQGMTRRWSRAVGFGLAALVTSAAAWTSMAIKDPFRPTSTKEGLPFMIAFGTSLFAATAGVVDSSFGAGELR